MEAKKIMVVSAGLGVPSSSRLLADRLLAETLSQLAGAGVVAEGAVLELRELAVPIANNLVTGYAPPVLEEALRKVAEADALIVVTPVFSASYSGLFKSFFDVIEPGSLEGKPVLLAATGGSARHSLVLDFALRPLFAYLKAAIVPTGVFAAPMDWGVAEGESTQAPLVGRVERAARELLGLLGEARRGAAGVSLGSRPATRPEDRSFEELLAGLGAGPRSFPR